MACSRLSPAIASPALLQSLLEPASLPACKHILCIVTARSEEWHRQTQAFHMLLA